MLGGKRNKANKGNSPEKGQTGNRRESESTLALMLQGRGLEIINNERIKDINGINEET